MSEENEMTDITTTGFVPIDFTRLPKLEAVIKRGLSTFLQVGRALLEIHDGRLYAAEHRTFEEYCSKRWKLSVQRGYQLIDAAKVIDSFSTTVEIEPPQSERAARELAETLRHEGPEAAAEAWQHAVEQHGSQPTAEQVRETVRGTSGPASRSDLVLQLADSQCRWVEKLQRFIEHDLGDEPLPERVREQLAIGALRRAHAVVEVLDALAAGEPPHLDVLDSTVKFSEETI
jgi:hypothetical protein